MTETPRTTPGPGTHQAVSVQGSQGFWDASRKAGLGLALQHLITLEVICP